MVGEGDSGLGVPHLFPCRTWGRCGGGKGGAARAQGYQRRWFLWMRSAAGAACGSQKWEWIKKAGGQGKSTQSW